MRINRCICGGLPYCDGYAERYDYVRWNPVWKRCTELYAVHCNDCMASGSVRKSRRLAIKDWNKRNPKRRNR